MLWCRQHSEGFVIKMLLQNRSRPVDQIYGPVQQVILLNTTGLFFPPSVPLSFKSKAGGPDTHGINFKIIPPVIITSMNVTLA